MNTLKQFKRLYPELELVKDDKLHKALHTVSPSWYVFINRARNKVEVHDTAILRSGEIWGTHVMTEEYVSWKIVHDALKYNSKNHDITETIDKMDRKEDANRKLKADRDKKERIHYGVQTIMGG